MSHSVTASSNDNCLIGIDAGTSLVKAVAFDATGVEICHHELSMPLQTLNPKRVEQDMEQLWWCVETALGHVASELKTLQRSISGVGVTSTGDGTLLMKSDGTPARHGILWCDGRAAEIVERFHEKGTAAEAFEGPILIDEEHVKSERHCFLFKYGTAEDQS